MQKSYFIFILIILALFFSCNDDPVEIENISCEDGKAKPIYPKEGNKICINETIQFSFCRVNGASDYELYAKSENDKSYKKISYTFVEDDENYNEDTITISSKLACIFKPNTTVYWYIKASNHFQEYDNEVKSFYLKDCGVDCELKSTPEPIYPENGQKICDSTIRLEWTSVKNADRYIVRYQQDEFFGYQILADDVKETYYDIPMELKPMNDKEYLWQIEAVNNCQKLRGSVGSFYIYDCDR